MICDKCGKSNIVGLAKCAYCKSDMPKTTDGGGFSDILSYKSSSDTIIDINATKKEGISEEDMQKLIRKSDNIIMTTQKNSLFGLIAIGLSLVILLTSIIFGIVTINSVKKYQETTTAQIEELSKKLTENQNPGEPAGDDDENLSDGNETAEPPDDVTEEVAEELEPLIDGMINVMK